MAQSPSNQKCEEMETGEGGSAGVGSPFEVDRKRKQGGLPGLDRKEGGTSPVLGNMPSPG